MPGLQEILENANTPEPGARDLIEEIWLKPLRVCICSSYGQALSLTSIPLGTY